MVTGEGKATAPTDPLVLPAGPATKRDSEGVARDPHGDEEMDGKSQTSATSSKKRATALSKHSSMVLNDTTFAARLVTEISLQNDLPYMEEYAKVLARYGHAPEEGLNAALNGHNIMAGKLDSKPEELGQKAKTELPDELEPPDESEATS